jgi:hypothetical protein
MFDCCFSRERNPQKDGTAPESRVSYYGTGANLNAYEDDEEYQ